MKPGMFRQSVAILVGLGYRHLVEWPASLRDTARSVVLKACNGALRGEIEAETTRGR